MRVTYDPIPSRDKPGVHWEVVSAGRYGTDCKHAEVEKTVWYAGPGGPLVEVKCLACQRHLKERLDGRSHAWPVEDVR